MARGVEPILVNPVGFHPNAGKWCMCFGSTADKYEIVDERGGRIATGQWQVVKGDTGTYQVACLSQIASPGAYEFRSAGRRSVRITLRQRIYDEAILKCVSYFAKQRCGDSAAGYNAPCHLDDGVRSDTRAAHDVSGGWHDACDVRKWVSATIYGLVGLYRVLDVWDPEQASRDRILEEMRWGNGYFLKMQEPDGSLMSYCGGDDGNHFTDNVRGTGDDRRIHIEPADLPEQFHFIAAQAALGRRLKVSEPAYAARCLEAAHRCLRFCTTRRSVGAASSLSAAVLACLEMDRTESSEPLRELAAQYVQKLIALQVTPAQSKEVHGFFLAKPDDPEPYRDIMHGNLPLLALCAAGERLQQHRDVQSWRNALQVHCEHLLQMAERSAFGVVPFGLYAAGDPGGGRRVGRYWYRWFMKTHGETSAAEWWVGINAHLASTGVGLVRASRLLNDPRLADAAQRQLDWILGVNPFGASTVTGVGSNQPRLFVTSEFKPPTPMIDGGVMNGIGGSEDDEPQLRSGSYHTCEYWTPMVAYTMWLMAELQTL